MPDGQVTFEISADGRKAYATVDDITKAIKKAGKEWDHSVQEATGNMQSAFTKALDINRVKDWALKAGKAMLDFGIECLHAASDLAEVQNVVDVTFGEGAAEIERWAKKAQSSFGLTETQAKRFTSTMGAMMKSAGLTGPEIVSMSEDLAGLAADMASFYNLDFETAFNKIRSGISGETEPLKQLGINMSVANLEAFALTQGITKAFDKMSQGEQTMLRYQYLMQATADAQGDFARTADGYANAQRRVQTALESIKTSIGTAFYDTIAGATGALADFLEEVSKPRPTTVMDDFAKIDLDTATKIAEIQQTAEEAETLISTLQSISGQVINYSQSGNLVSFIQSLSGNISGLDDALKLAKQGDLTGAIDNLASHLAQELGGDPEKWENLLQAIGNNAELAISATQGDSAKTKEFLEKVASGADDLTTDYSSYWSNLLGVLGDKAGDAITALAGGGNAGGVLSGIAGGANLLKDGTSAKWSAFAKALGLLDDKGNVPTNLSGVADALAKNLGGDASKWETMLQAIGNNLPSVTTAVGNDGQSTASWLTKAAEAADDLGGDYSQNWKKLLVVYGDHAGAAITALATTNDPGSVIAGIAGGANALKDGASAKWSAFARALGILDDKGNVPTTLQGVADALATNLGGDASKWEEMLKAIGGNLPMVTKAVGEDKGAAGQWLSAAAQSAALLGSDYSENWKKLMVVYGEKAGDAIAALATTSDPGGVLGGIATGANKLSIKAPTLWRGIFGALTSVDGLSNIFNNGNAATNVENLAEALSGNSPDTSRAEAWKTFLDALSTNPEALTTLTQTDATQTAEWLKKMSEGVNAIDPTDADAWDKLFADFVQGLPGLNNTEGGHAFFETIAQEFLAMGNQSEEAKAGLAALGLSTEEIDQVQREWLLTCQELVQKIPGLSDVIDVNTGEVKGGITAVRDYKDAWYEASMEIARSEALIDKRKAFAVKEKEMVDYEVALKKAQAALDNFIADHPGIVERRNRVDQSGGAGIFGYRDKDLNTLTQLETGVRNAQAAADNFRTKLDEGAEELKYYEDNVGSAAKKTEEYSDKTEDAAASMSTLQKAAKGDADAFSSVEKAVKDAHDAIKELSDYQDKVFNETSQSVGNVIKGFEKLGEKKPNGEWVFMTPVEQAKQQVEELKIERGKLDSAAKDYEKRWQEFTDKINKLGVDAPSVQNMTQALDSQLEYIKQYNEYMAQARQKGVNEDLLASLADGSQESFDYLKALATTGGSIKELNEKYKQVKEASEGFTTSLTNQKLAVDETYNSLLETAREAVAGLNLGDESYKSVEETVNGIVKALGDNKSKVETEVNAILELIGKLGSANYGMRFGLGGGFAGSWSSAGIKTPDKHANGLDYVPYDGYLALLHQGERIQTAAEADLARRYSYQQPSGFDYNAMGQAVGANIPNFGNMQIIWRGRVVADILSEEQADSYRAMERSGWR